MKKKFVSDIDILEMNKLGQR